MAKKTSRCLVVDASVARASGGEDATYPTSKRCRDFLISARTICHRIVMTPELSKEWKDHCSNFARQWRVSMVARKKVCPTALTSYDEIYTKIECVAPNEKVREAMLKDLHLIEAAQATDRIVISLDETVRDLFAEAAQSVGELRSIIWVNPSKEKERPIQWLENGAKADKYRQLGFRSQKIRS